MTEARKFLWIALISTFGFSMTWTGLPVWLAQQSGNQSRLGDLFLISSLTTLLFVLIGGQLTDRFSKKKITIWAELSSAALLLLVLAASGQGQAGHPVLLLVLFFYFGVRAVGSNAESVWFLSTPADSGVAISATNRQLVLAAAKVLGMSSGPFLFQTLGNAALLLNVATFVVTSLLFVGIQDHKAVETASNPEPSFRDILKCFKETPASRALLMFVTGLLGVPMVNFNLNRLLADAPVDTASFFWGAMPIIGLLGGFFSKWLLTRKVPSDSVLVSFSFGACFSSLYSTFVVGPQILLSSGIFALTNQSTRTLLNVKYFQEAQEGAKGRTMATVTAIEELGELVGHILVSYVLIDRLWVFGLVSFAAGLYRVYTLGQSFRRVRFAS